MTLCDCFNFSHFKKILILNVILSVTLEWSFIFIVISDLSLRAHCNANHQIAPSQQLLRYLFIFMTREKYARSQKGIYSQDGQLNLWKYYYFFQLSFKSHPFILVWTDCGLIRIMVLGSFLFNFPLMDFKCPFLIWILMLIDQVVLVSQTSLL